MAKENARKDKGATSPRPAEFTTAVSSSSATGPAAAIVLWVISPLAVLAGLYRVEYACEHDSGAGR